MADDKEVLFSSFMAGLLLCRKSITYLEIANEISDFQNYGYSLIEPCGDFNKISPLLVEENMSFILKYDYTEMINNMTIYDYLYGLTCKEVRKYYGLPEKVVSIDNIAVVRKKTWLDRFKRTKAVC